MQDIASSSVGLRVRRSRRRNHFNHSFSSDVYLRREYIPFFIKPNLKLALFTVNRNIFNHIEARWMDGTVLEARISNVGHTTAEMAQISLKIDDITVDYEIHPWQALQFAAIQGGGYSQTPVVSIRPDQHALSFISNVAPELPYGFTVTLYNQMTGQNGHRLELDKEYNVYLMVTGDFKSKTWSFKIRPTHDKTIEFSQPTKLKRKFLRIF
jgi:hypothetical protein